MLCTPTTTGSSIKVSKSFRIFHAAKDKEVQIFITPPKIKQQRFKMIRNKR